MPRPSTSERYSSITVPSVAVTRNAVGVYQTRSMSMRASVPMTDAVLGPAARELTTRDDTAPPVWVAAIATSVSAPVSPRRPIARMPVIGPRTSHANDTG